MPPKLPIDFYNGPDALKFEPPPQPAASTKDPNLLRLYVPSENSALDMGAGKVPGIRMVTNNHVHLTARLPLTTISLGAPGGDGVESLDAPGLRLHTDGDKWETIKGETMEWFFKKKTEYVKEAWTQSCDDLRREHVKGQWDQSCENAKTEVIAGTVTQNFASEHNLTVGKLAVHTFNSGKVDHVVGDWNTHVTGNHTETIDGDKKYRYKARHLSIADGAVNDIFFGEKGSINYGANLSSNMVLKYERNLGVSVAITDGLRATRDFFKVDRSNIRTQKIDVNLDDKETVITRSETAIKSVGMLIIK